MKAIELLKEIKAVVSWWKGKESRSSQVQYLVCQVEAELEKTEIQLEVSRKLGKGHKDRELANAKRCDDYYGQIKQLRTELTKTEAENKRLKEALEQIANWTMYSGKSRYDNAQDYTETYYLMEAEIFKAKKIAKAALAKGEKE
ncbi:MAG TPA: hypothetical protein VMW25_00335 [Clostridia bacterium]|nr:hypothetical protein [Clostridia bacterium]